MTTNNSDFPRKILLCIDGESHTNKAIDWAIKAVQVAKADLTVLHIKEMYLKQFYNEIYAQGRREYLIHVEREIQEHAIKTFSLFDKKAQEERIEYRKKEETCDPLGNPLEIIIKEFEKNDYDLIVVGGEQLKGMKAIRSRNIPAKLAARIKDRALLIVRE